MSRIKIIAAYDWATWIMGAVRAFISGAAGAIAAPIGPMAMDPGDYNLAGGLHKVLTSMLITGLVTGIAAMAVFLKTHSGPDAVQASLAVAATATSQASSAIAQAQDAAEKK